MDIFNEKSGEVANAIDLTALEEELPNANANYMKFSSAYKSPTNVHQAMLANGKSLL